jgi:hypothetical protein
MRFFLAILFFSISSIAYTQEILTISEVFDFEPGDVFHYLEDMGEYNPGSSTSQKRINRITILDRYYSKAEDTLFYKRSIEGYRYYISDYDENHYYIYKYSFHNYKDSVFYTNLDSSIFYYLYNVYYPYMDLGRYDEDPDTLISFSTEYCNHNVNEYLSHRWNFYDFEFGKGIGITKDIIVLEECSCYTRNIKLIYFNKYPDSCGIADTFTDIAKIFKNTDINLWPNPANDIVNIEKPNSDSTTEIIFYDINGKIVLTEKIKEKTSQIDISFLSNGVYSIRVIQNKKVTSLKFVKI